MYLTDQKQIEIDITYQCNLNCFNCNRSCGHVSETDEMIPQQIERFVNESLRNEKEWKEIRIIGGEPTLHPDIIKICLMLLVYKDHYPKTRISISTNGFGKKVQQVLKEIPKGILIQNSRKSSPRQPNFVPIQVAPIDTGKAFNYVSGCPITKYGYGLNRYGYYHCCVAGGIDRIFGYDIGRKHLPETNDLMIKERAILCRLCGNFLDKLGLKRSSEQISSPIWRKAIENFKNKRPRKRLY